MASAFRLHGLTADLLRAATFATALVAAGCGDSASTDAGTPTDTTVDRVAAGQMLVAMRGCHNCHSAMDATDLGGQTSPRPMTMAYGKNLTPDPDTGLGMWTDAQIIAATRDGTARDGSALCGTMPRYRTLTAEQLASLVAYLRSLPAVRRMIPASTCAAGDGGTPARDASAD